MKYYTPKQVADICGVTRQTVYNWIVKGIIQPESIGKKYAKLIPETEIPTFLRKGGDKVE